jgi:hypothetical protein
MQAWTPPARVPAADEFVRPRAPTPAPADVVAADASTPGAPQPARPSAELLLSHRDLTANESGALAASQTPTDAPAQEYSVPNNPGLSDRFYIGFGGYFATSTTEAKLESPSGIGTSVNFEDTLGLSEREWTPQALARWRFSTNWRMELEYFSLHRENSTKIDGQIDWGGQTYPINTVVQSKFNIDVTRLSVGYSFFKRPDKEIGVAFGLHMTNIDAELSNSSGGQAKGAAALAPLPVFSLYGLIALTDRWSVNGRFDAFKLEYDPYQGSVFSTGLDVLYQPWRHVGFGLGYRDLTIDVSVDKNNWTGSINSGFQGPIAFVFASF